VANCSAERAFPKLTKIKNKYRTSQPKENLISLMILYSENDIGWMKLYNNLQKKNQGKKFKL
jgi:hypothetical protein